MFGCQQCLVVIGHTQLISVELWLLLSEWHHRKQIAGKRKLEKMTWLEVGNNIFLSFFIFPECLLLRFMYCRCNLGEHVFKCVMKLDVALVEKLNLFLRLFQHVSVLVSIFFYLDCGVGRDSAVFTKIFVLIIHFQNVTISAIYCNLLKVSHDSKFCIQST